MRGKHKLLTTSLAGQAEIQRVQMSLIWRLLNMLELIYVIIRKVLLERTPNIIRFLVQVFQASAPTICHFYSLISLSRDKHRVQIIVHVIIDRDSSLEQHSLFLLLLLRLLPLFLLPLILSFIWLSFS
jgi:hypothetical protein